MSTNTGLSATLRLPLISHATCSWTSPHHQDWSGWMKGKTYITSERSRSTSTSTCRRGRVISDMIAKLPGLLARKPQTCLQSETWDIYTRTIHNIHRVRTHPHMFDDGSTTPLLKTFLPKITPCSTIADSDHE